MPAANLANSLSAEWTLRNGGYMRLIASVLAGLSVHGAEARMVTLTFMI
jgi:hypothetical protein